MYFYCIGMWTRAEDPRNRTYADLFPFTYRLQDAEVSTYALHNLSCSYLDQPELQSAKNVIIVMVDVCVYVQLT